MYTLTHRHRQHGQYQTADVNHVGEQQKGEAGLWCVGYCQHDPKGQHLPAEQSDCQCRQCLQA